MFFELLGVDDHVEAVISQNGNGVSFAVADIGDTPPPGSLAFSGFTALSGPGSTYRLSLAVVNNPNYPIELQPLPIGGGDGTAVVGRFRVEFDDGQPVPEPGTLSSAGLALAVALGVRRRTPRRGRR